MKSTRIPLFTLIILGLLLAACAPGADYDIRGDWDYTMTASDGNTYDAGSITFSGEPVQGTYLETNIYQVEYEGEFRVNGASLQLTSDETWEGTIQDENTITGTWSHTNGAAGTFTATRK